MSSNLLKDVSRIKISLKSQIILLYLEISASAQLSSALALLAVRPHPHQTKGLV